LYTRFVIVVHDTRQVLFTIKEVVSKIYINSSSKMSTKLVFCGTRFFTKKKKTKCKKYCFFIVDWGDPSKIYVPDQRPDRHCPRELRLMTPVWKHRPAILQRNIPGGSLAVRCFRATDPMLKSIGRHRKTAALRFSLWSILWWSWCDIIWYMPAQIVIRARKSFSVVRFYI